MDKQALLTPKSDDDERCRNNCACKYNSITMPNVIDIGAQQTSTTIPTDKRKIALLLLFLANVFDNDGKQTKQTDNKFPTNKRCIALILTLIFISSIFVALNFVDNQANETASKKVDQFDYLNKQQNLLLFAQSKTQSSLKLSEIKPKSRQLNCDEATANSGAFRNVLLVRHGESKIDGRLKELTPIGRIQAKFSGKLLARINSQTPLNSFVMSALPRAIETAAIILAEVGDERLRSRAVIDSLMDGWDVGSTLPANYERMDAAYAHYFQPAPRHATNSTMNKRNNKSIGVYDVLVCHSSVIRYFVMKSVNFPPEDWWMLPILPNASLSRIVVNSSGNATLCTYGDANHIPKKLITVN